MKFVKLQLKGELTRGNGEHPECGNGAERLKYRDSTQERPHDQSNKTASKPATRSRQHSIRRDDSTDAESKPLERVVREHLLTQVGPEIGNFYRTTDANEI